MSFEIIDFHTHPFIDHENIASKHKDMCDMSAAKTRKLYKNLGISKICGSVIMGKRPEDKNAWEKLKRNNDIALKLRDYYGDFYIPGFHVHPDFLEESIDEIHRMHSLGVNLIGEIVACNDGWSGYSRDDFSQILDEAGKYNMVVSLHSEYDDEMDAMVKRHPDIIFVAAHPGEYPELMRHLERAKFSENYYLDISGTGLFRYGMLRAAVEAMGADRVIFGSDFPCCTPGMFLGGVLYDDFLTDDQKEKIFSGNAKRILGL